MEKVARKGKPRSVSRKTWKLKAGLIGSKKIYCSSGRLLIRHWVTKAGILAVVPGLGAIIVREWLGNWKKRVAAKLKKKGGKSGGFSRRRSSGLALPRSASPNHPVSRWLRKAFELRWVKKALGWPLAGTTLLGAMVSPVPALSNFSNNSLPREEVIRVEEMPDPLTTKAAIKLPVEKVDISQDYSQWHPAIDLKANWGSPMWAIDSGVVVKVNSWQWGYGNHLVIDHGRGRRSLYAHLSSIEVKVGEKVENGQQIGRVGSTGRSTGSHLHLEIIEDGKRVNPREVLKI